MYKQTKMIVQSTRMPKTKTKKKDHKLYQKKYSLTFVAPVDCIEKGREGTKRFA